MAVFSHPVLQLTGVFLKAWDESRKFPGRRESLHAGYVNNIVKMKGSKMNGLICPWINCTILLTMLYVAGPLRAESLLSIQDGCLFVTGPGPWTLPLPAASGGFITRARCSCIFTNRAGNL